MEDIVASSNVPVGYRSWRLCQSPKLYGQHYNSLVQLSTAGQEDRIPDDHLQILYSHAGRYV